MTWRSAAAAFLAVATLAATAERSFVVDRAASRAVIAVGKSGALSFMAGHKHDVTAPIGGTLAIDPDDLAQSRVHLTIDAASLKVSAEGEPPEDVPKVQQVMLSDEVLDVQRYPRIEFESISIAVKHRTAAAADLAIRGTLLLHGVKRPLTIPVHADLSGAKIVATGEFSVKQTEFGMKPVSVGGVVAVKDALGISFTITGHRK